MKLYSIYKISTKKSIDHTLSWYKGVEKHSLIFLRICESEKEAIQWLEENHIKYVNYTILPRYTFD